MLRLQLLPSIMAKTTAVLIPSIVITVGDAYKNRLFGRISLTLLSCKMVNWCFCIIQVSNCYKVPFYSIKITLEVHWYTCQNKNAASAYVTQSRETVPNRTSGKIKLTPPAYSHTTLLLVSSLTYVRLIVAEVNWQWCERLGWWFQTLASAWAGYIQVGASFSSPNVHSVDCALFQPLRSQHTPGCFFGFTSALPQFWNITFSRQSIPTTHPM